MPDANLSGTFVLRRLGDPLPADFSSAPALQWGVALAAVAAGLALAAWRYRRERALPALVRVPLAGVRLVAVACLAFALGAPRLAVEEWGNVAWLGVAAAGLLASLSMVAAWYAVDRRAAGWRAVPLAILRGGVFALLTWAFLLPAVQYWERVEKRSRVVILLDVTPSVTATSDEQASPGGKAGRTRLQTVLDFLTDEQVGFLSKILDKNPVAFYRFGTRLDDDAQMVEAGQTPWTREEWAAWAAYDFKPWLLRSLTPAGRALVAESAAWKGAEPGTAEWALAWAKLPAEETTPAALSEEDKAALADARGKVENRVDVARSVVTGTNVPDSLLAAVNREGANLAQGIIVFSDGRSNLGTQAGFRTLRERAVREKIPLFTVAVGEFRETVQIAITDFQAPDRAPPDEQSKLVVEADGVGLAEAEVMVRVGLYLPGRDPKSGPPDFELPPAPLKFRGDATPPHGQAEFQLDPEKLPESLTEESKKPGKKRQLKQGAWQAVARIARDKRETSLDAEHASPPRTIQVIDRPTRVLLFAGGPTREYQTLRTLLVREAAQSRAELTICLQNEGGREGTAVQDVPAERLLPKFPTKLDTGPAPGKPEEKLQNLNEYDLVIAFDPDWSELSAEQIKNLQTWVDNLGGGLIYVGGPLNTYQLARADQEGRLKPLLDIMPVVPDDIILVKTRGTPRTPRRVSLKPNPEFDVLKLEDEPAEDAVAGWEPFFTGRPKFLPSASRRDDLTPDRGFYSYYPVKQTKPGATTLAEFLDADEKGDVAPRPWLVSAQPKLGRTVFLAAGETWLFRAYNQDYFDKFWVKLSRYAAGNRDARRSRGRVLIGKEFSSGSQIRVQARLLAPNGDPYDVNVAPPKFRIERYSATNEKEKEDGPFELRARKGGGEFDGYYAGQVLADPARFPAGDKRYRVVLDVPDSAGDVLTGDFSLKKSDPELDNTRPDPAALEQMAGSVEEVRGRVKDPAVLEKLRGRERDYAKAKLAFRLADPEQVALIPACFEANPKTESNRGPVRDLWDAPATIPLPWGGEPLTLFEGTLGGTPFRVGWLLAAVVGLLGVEWLTRKLLRLA